MILSIITINRNNAAGLEKTMQSVLSQTRKDFEYVVVDGASTDASVAVIERFAPAFGERLKWVSEPDKGIYNAMNKGIGMATGEYVQFLNSGDSLVSSDVWEKVSRILLETGRPPILYGNRIRFFSDGHTIHDVYVPDARLTFYKFYTASLSHQATLIQRSLFDQYGLYDESLRVVSDWKWFMKVIALEGVKAAHADIDVVFFDANGISQTDWPLHLQERRSVLNAMIPASILADYEAHTLENVQLKRLKRHPWANKLFRLLDRFLIKIEKWGKQRGNG